MATTFTSSTSFVVEYCCHDGCSIAFGVHRDHYNRLRANPGTPFYCPNGHKQWYTGDSEAEKLRKAQAREQALRDQLDAAVRDADQQRVTLLRERTRIAHGICPCCNRSFDNVRRHMAGQHPDYVAKHGTPEPTYKCSCGAAFDTFRGLRTHQGHLRRPGWERQDQPWRQHLTVV